MKEALQMHLESMVSGGEEAPKVKGIAQHIADGVFNPGEIADEYFITEVYIAVPQHA